MLKPLYFTGAALSAAMVVFAGERAIAASFSIYDTGVNASGAALGLGESDPHWQVNGGAAYAIESHPAWTVGNMAETNWINPTENPDAQEPLPAASYSYTQTFDLSGLDYTTASLSGVWSADNNAEIYLNGASTGFTVGQENFREGDGLSEFAINAGFVEGLNTIEVRIENYFRNGDGSIRNNNPSPSGLYVDFQSAEAQESVPEPALLLGLLTVGGVGAALKRR